MILFHCPFCHSDIPIAGWKLDTSLGGDFESLNGLDEDTRIAVLGPELKNHLMAAHGRSE